MKEVNLSILELVLGQFEDELVGIHSILHIDKGNWCSSTTSYSSSHCSCNAHSNLMDIADNMRLLVFDDQVKLDVEDVEGLLLG
jgi:hypothetical protein